MDSGRERQGQGKKRISCGNDRQKGNGKGKGKSKGKGKGNDGLAFVRPTLGTTTKTCRGWGTRTFVIGFRKGEARARA